MKNEVPDTRSTYGYRGFIGLHATPTFAKLDRVGVATARWLPNYENQQQKKRIASSFLLLIQQLNVYNSHAFKIILRYFQTKKCDQ
jgi:hypothetical protein